jgi:hypothetical protein
MTIGYYIVGGNLHGDTRVPGWDGDDTNNKRHTIVKKKKKKKKKNPGTLL